MVTNAAGDHDSKSLQRTGGGFGAPLCSCVFSYSYSATRYSYSYSIRTSIAIRPIGLQFLANRLDQRSASPPFQQPSSTSTVSLSTASLSTSTTKSDAIDPGGSTNFPLRFHWFSERTQAKTDRQILLTGPLFKEGRRIGPPKFSNREQTADETHDQGQAADDGDSIGL